MFGFVIFLHTLVCILLATIILMQAGRGGGLTENFSSAESMFGARTNVVLVKATTILASLFLVTCLTLAFFSMKSSKSLIAANAAKEKQAGALPAAAKDAVAVATQEAAPKTVAEAQKVSEDTNPVNVQPDQAASPSAPANPQ